MYSKNEEEIFKILNSNIDGLDSKETEKRLKAVSYTHLRAHETS